MTPDETDAVRQLISGDSAAAAALLARAMTSTEPLVLIAAALLDPGSPGFLARAVSAAERPADRQLTALAAAHLAGDPDLVSARWLASTCLDHPDSVLAARIAAGVTTRTTTRTSPRAWNAPAPTPKELPMSRKLTAVLLIAAAVLTNAAFTVLGSVFSYPDVLRNPSPRSWPPSAAHQAQVSFWFGVMAAVGRPLRADRRRRRPPVPRGRAMRMAVPVGVAAAVVQAVGLSRWPLLVPGSPPTPRAPTPSRRRTAESPSRPRTSSWATVVGETLGYLFTAAWTLLVLVALHRSLAWVLVHRARRRVRGPHPRGSPVTPGPAPSSTRRTSRATCCGASGSSRSACCCWPTPGPDGDLPAWSRAGAGPGCT